MGKTNHDTQMLADPVQAAALEADAARWRERDLAVLWHPCTQMREHPGTLPLLPIARGEGAWLVGRDGRRYLDAISSWWTNLFGHAEPRLADAIAQQARTLEHVILAGCSHAPAVELAERLLAVAPRQAGRSPLAKVFYADNGSAGVEVALKMAFHWFRNRGEQRRTRFIALENGYHGETIGALSVGDIPLYRRVYAPLLMEALFAPSPDAYLCEPGETPAERARRAAAALRVILERHDGEVCALILEPRLQCAGGMRMHDPLYLTLARALCDEFGVFLIADEIAVGFGRTGTLFACEQAPVLNEAGAAVAGTASTPTGAGSAAPVATAGIQPDFLCLSKGLTGGALPLAAVLTTDAVYNGFLDDSRERAFLHSHSYTGNPLACAAALASLDIFEQDDIIERNRATAATMARHAQALSDHPHVAEVRQAGMVVAFELARGGNRGTPFAPAARVGLHAYRTALEQGVLLRPLGDVLYWMPPYCIDEDALAHLATTTRTAIDRAIEDSRACA
ncbi:aminotransferase class III-fold pyridoxal phosphate-dependent enzyme [Aerolutibacter ruishenii]|uniref:Adenosylmethionine-8-amino-7-oxononanoate aminotransferase n=1 Tax=Aerolutibacter ruishenii TaxID=686800 RepID=A0A562M2A9_9GAMM|nr:aminotransferase class III-fold pyridoxal phosphate-dependent enzyme [Lysobacter ruishenii]TWI14087.1 adenosylmethionine-8-amino-7-oxononanoate aminotransferase apoenzyme [Lysobacter ruishenii]